MRFSLVVFSDEPAETSAAGFNGLAWKRIA